MSGLTKFQRRKNDLPGSMPSLAAIVCLCLWLLFTIYDLRNANVKELITFGHQAEKFVDQIESRLNTARSILTGFSAVLDLNSFSRDTIDSLDYYVDTVAHEHPEIWMIEASKRITESGRLTLVKTMKSLGYADFSIRRFSYQNDRTWQDVPIKETYTPLIYAGPKQNLTDPIIGLDYESVDFLQQALLESITQKKVTTSRPFNLIEGPRAVALFFPLVTNENTIANLIVLTDRLNTPDDWLINQTQYKLVYDGDELPQDQTILFSNSNPNHEKLKNTWLFPAQSLSIPLTSSELPLTLIISHQTSLANLKVILWRDISLALISSLLLFLLLLTKEKLRLSIEKTHQQIAENEQKLRFALTGANAGYWYWDFKKSLIFRDAISTQILGYDMESLVQTPEQWCKNIHPDDRALISKVLEELALGNKDEISLEYRMFNKQGDIIWVLDKAKVTEFDQDGEPTRLSGIFMNITDKKRLELELEEQATTDFLTGALNRRTFLKRVEEEMARNARYPESMSLLMIDIDLFKHVNDTYGHQLGDKVLEFVSTVIRENLRNIDTFGRLGGEEFAILMPETTLEEAFMASERIRTAVESLQVPVNSGKPISVTISIGLTQQLSSHTTSSDMLKDADNCLYEAKHKGRNKTIMVNHA